MKKIVLLVAVFAVAACGHNAQKPHNEAVGDGEEEDEANLVHFSDEQAQNVTFAIGQCEKGEAFSVIKTVGQILPAASDCQTITSKTSGVVSGVKLTEGSAVKTGEVICHIDRTGFAENDLQVKYKEAEGRYTLAKSEYERKKELAKEKIVTFSSLQQAENEYITAKTAYENLRKNFSTKGEAVKAPMSGYLKQMVASNGLYVEAGQLLAQVVKNQNLYIKAEVASNYYNSLKNITDVSLRAMNDTKVYSLKELKGKLLSYGQGVSPESPLLPVVFQVQNVTSWLSGTFIEMYIKSSENREAIMLPNTALVEEMGNFFVYRQVEPEHYEKKEVALGVTDGIKTEIVKGLSGTEIIVTEGAIYVKLAQAAGGLDAHSGHVH